MLSVAVKNWRCVRTKSGQWHNSTGDVHAAREQSDLSNPRLGEKTVSISWTGGFQIVEQFVKTAAQRLANQSNETAAPNLNHERSFGQSAAPRRDFFGNSYFENFLCLIKSGLWDVVGTYLVQHQFMVDSIPTRWNIVHSLVFAGHSL